MKGQWHKAILAGSMAAYIYPATAWAQVDSSDPSAPASMSAPAPTAPQQQGGLTEIIVTATKRSEAVNRVPISISAVSGEQLTNRGITSPADLDKVVPGFTFVQSQFGPPVFTLRGIGFYDTSLGSKPSVSVYQDEVPLPFSILTKGAAMDLERVEVLKGPQGTLFGQNATGGAVNYIAAKPTSTFKTGGDIGYASFDAIDASGFVSGPITDTIGARLAFTTQQGGGFQRSVTRPNDELGDRNFTAGRLTVDFKPAPGISFVLGLNGYIDKSDPAAAQAIARLPLVAPRPGNQLATAPLALPDARSADWSPGVPRADNKFYQAYLRGDFDLSDAVTVTSISAYSRFDADFTVDPDGLALNVVSFATTGRLSSLSQELRVAGEVSGLKFIVGGNISRDKTRQNDIGSIVDSTSAPTFAAFGLPPFNFYGSTGRQKFVSRALFGNVDYDIGEYFTLHGGLRYTKTDIDYRGCSYDVDGNLAAGVNSLINFVVRPAFGRPGTTSAAQGGCVTINTNQASPDFLAAGEVVSELNEDNLSWRAGVDFKPSRDALIYASVSRGYKTGSFPVVSATDSRQFDPARQESVTAYELGYKITALNRTIQLNGALFYYDYRDKQFLGRRIGTPNIFGPLLLLVNVPKSSVKGAEVQADIVPTPGLRFTIAGTYLDTEINGSYVDSDPFGAFGERAGEPIQYTPKYQVQLDGQYDWSIGSGTDAFIGADMQFRSDTNSSFGRDRIFDIRDYTLIGLRGGLKFDDGRYHVSAFVRNLTNAYYWTNAIRITDTAVRFAGPPRTFGATIGFRY